MFWAFFLLLCGLSVATSVWSNGIFTIQIFLVPLLILISIELNHTFNNQGRHQTKWDKKLYAVWLLGLVIIVALRTTTVLNWNVIDTTGAAFPFWLPSQDMAFYGELAEKLVHLPHESVFFDEQVNQRGTMPYHYFELWLSAFFAELFSISGYVAYSLCTLPLLELTFFTGLLTLYAQQKRSFSPFWLLLALFLTGIYLPFYDEVKLGATYWLSNSIFTGLSEHYFWWIAVAIAYQRGNLHLCVYLICCLPFVSPTLWTACWGGLFVILLAEKMKWLSTNCFQRKELVLFGSLPIAYVAFYACTQAKQSVASPSSSAVVFIENPSLIISTLTSLALYVCAIVVIYLPFGFILYKFLRLTTKNKLVLLFSLGAMLGGISLYILLPLHQESFQFIRNFVLPFCQITILYVAIEKYNYLKSKEKLAFLALLVYGVVFTLYWFWRELAPHQVYSQTYVQQVFNELSKRSSSKKGITLHGEKAYTITPIFNYHGNFRQPATYLTFRKDITQVYNLDMSCLALQHRVHTSLLDADYFYQWLKKHQAQRCTKDLIWQFIETQHPDFLILGKEIHFPKEKMYLIDAFLMDSTSGERFFILKK